MTYFDVPATVARSAAAFEALARRLAAIADEAYTMGMVLDVDAPLARLDAAAGTARRADEREAERRAARESLQAKGRTSLTGRMVDAELRRMREEASHG